jgi:peptidoglycan-N-acetylglucosamine deacetylase
LITILKPALPPGKKVSVCLSFDFDAISSPLRRQTPVEVSQGEFAVIGAERILKLLKKYSIRTTWYVPGHTVDTFPESVKEIFEQGHEIAHHNYLHEDPTTLSRENEEIVVRRAKASIKRITGRDPAGYRSPAWKFSPNTISILLEEKFAYDSSMMALDYLPYKVRQGDVIPEDGPYKFGNDTEMIEIPVAWSLDDFPHFEFVPGYLTAGLRPISSVLENWAADFDYMYDNVPGGIFNLVLHPEVTGRGHRMILLEKIIQHIMEKGDVWFAPTIEVVDSCK